MKRVVIISGKESFGGAAKALVETATLLQRLESLTCSVLLARDSEIVGKLMASDVEARVA